MTKQRDSPVTTFALTRFMNCLKHVSVAASDTHVSYLPWTISTVLLWCMAPGNSNTSKEKGKER